MIITDSSRINRFGGTHCINTCIKTHQISMLLEAKNQTEKQWHLLPHVQGGYDQMNWWKTCNHSYVYMVLCYVTHLMNWSYYLKILFIYFRQRGRKGEREGEKYQCVVASCAPPTGDLTWPTTQACALPGNQTSDPFDLKLVLNPLSHSNQGWSYFLK